MQPPAQVRVALLAHLAAPARLSRVDRHARAALQRLEGAIQGIRADLRHHAGELVAKDQRRLQRCVADPGVLVGMQIAPTDPDGGHTQQRLAYTGRAGMRHLLHAQVGGAVQAGGDHSVVGHVGLFPWRQTTRFAITGEQSAIGRRLIRVARRPAWRCPSALSPLL